MRTGRGGRDRCEWRRDLQRDRSVRGRVAPEPRRRRTHSRTAESIDAASPISHQPTLPGLDSGTSSPASADGLQRSDSPPSPTMPTSGRARVLCTVSATRARGWQNATLGIFGQHGSTSSASADLQRSLESRLRASSAFVGSTLFDLTWKDAVTPSGHRLCLLQASARRTSVTDFGSWPSPVTNDAKGSDYTYANGDHDRVCLKLGGAAKLVDDASSARSGRHRGGVSDAQAQGEGERREPRRVADEPVAAGDDGLGMADSAATGRARPDTGGKRGRLGRPRPDGSVGHADVPRLEARVGSEDCEERSVESTGSARWMVDTADGPGDGGVRGGEDVA